MRPHHNVLAIALANMRFGHSSPATGEKRVARQASNSSSSKKKPGSRPGFSFMGADRGLRHRQVRRHRAVPR
jgi:hypothetical protein